jgi:SAM-dependent methyltransferase
VRWAAQTCEPPSTPAHLTTLIDPTLHLRCPAPPRDPSSLKLIEVACGTGRFHTFIKDNYPAMQVGGLVSADAPYCAPDCAVVWAPDCVEPGAGDQRAQPCSRPGAAPSRNRPAPPHPAPLNPAPLHLLTQPQTIASDLSPYYLAAARDNIAEWKAKRQPSSDLGPGPDRAGTTFMQCAAEAIPVEDESLDVVVCIYLFHELPEEVGRCEGGVGGWVGWGGGEGAGSESRKRERVCREGGAGRHGGRGRRRRAAPRRTVARWRGKAGRQARRRPPHLLGGLKSPRQHLAE